MPQTPLLSSLSRAQRHPFLIVDADFRIRLVNRALEASFGLRSADLSDCLCCRLDFAPQTDCRHRRFFRDLEPYSETQTLILPNGEACRTQIQGFPVLDEESRIYLGESLRLLKPPPSKSVIVGSSATTQTFKKALAQSAATEVSVLLHGETGAGKELAAEYIHRHSPRAAGPFVIVDCTVLSEDLVESELFGHVKGAFTGAAGNKIGLLELADKGTLFLDEIGDLPLSQQPKLLRALETGHFRPVGATKTRRTNVRVVSASHRDLGALVQRGQFREDLFYRIAVFPITIPPLRVRREDIPELVENMLLEISATSGARYRIRKEALRKLLQYDYPGNIRELRNIIHLSAAMSQDQEITAETIRLPELGASRIANCPTAGHQRMDPNLVETLTPIESVEASYILDLLREHRGRRKEVAERLSISERTLYRKLKRYRLNSPGESTQND